LSQGKAGKIEGGDRLPWVKTRGEDNYAISEQIGWQVHVYGRASTEPKGWCDSRGMSFASLPGTKNMAALDVSRTLSTFCGLTRVGLAQPTQSLDELQRYWDSRMGKRLST
jgi:hypothetical protein